MPKDRPNFNKLKPKHKKFVMALTNDKATNPVNAVVAAGFSPHPTSAAIQASRLLAKPQVVAAITEVIAEKYPDVGEDCTRVLAQMINDPERADATRLKAIELMSKFLGWNAPTKHDTRKLVVNVDDKYRLPGSDK